MLEKRLLDESEAHKKIMAREISMWKERYIKARNENLRMKDSRNSMLFEMSISEEMWSFIKSYYSSLLGHSFDSWVMVWWLDIDRSPSFLYTFLVLRPTGRFRLTQLVLSALESKDASVKESGFCWCWGEVCHLIGTFIWTCLFRHNYWWDLYFDKIQ